MGMETGIVMMFFSVSWVDSLSIRDVYKRQLLPRIGSLIESPGFYPNLTGTENLRIFATLLGVPNNHAIKHALHLVGLPY